MPYLYEWPVSAKHAGKLTCDQCNKAAEYTFLIQKKNQADDHVKHVCSDDRGTMTSMYEALTGCKKQCSAGGIGLAGYVHTRSSSVRGQ